MDDEQYFEWVVSYTETQLKAAAGTRGEYHLTIVSATMHRWETNRPNYVQKQEDGWLLFDRLHLQFVRRRRNYEWGHSEFNCSLC